MHLIENLTYALHHVPASRAQARHHFLHTSFVESSLRSRRILAFDVQNFSGLVLSARSLPGTMNFGISASDLRHDRITRAPAHSRRPEDLPQERPHRLAEMPCSRRRIACLRSEAEIPKFIVPGMLSFLLFTLWRSSSSVLLHAI
jgi:hypothetical protein